MNNKIKDTALVISLVGVVGLTVGLGWSYFKISNQVDSLENRSYETKQRPSNMFEENKEALLSSLIKKTITLNLDQLKKFTKEELEKDLDDDKSTSSSQILYLKNIKEKILNIFKSKITSSINNVDILKYFEEELEKKILNVNLIGNMSVPKTEEKEAIEATGIFATYEKRLIKFYKLILELLKTINTKEELKYYFGHLKFEEKNDKVVFSLEENKFENIFKVFSKIKNFKGDLGATLNKHFVEDTYEELKENPSEKEKEENKAKNQLDFSGNVLDKPLKKDEEMERKMMFDFSKIYHKFLNPLSKEEDKVEFKNFCFEMIEKIKNDKEIINNFFNFIFELKDLSDSKTDYIGKKFSELEEKTEKNIFIFKTNLEIKNLFNDLRKKINDIIDNDKDKKLGTFVSYEEILRKKILLLNINYSILKNISLNKELEFEYNVDIIIKLLRQEYIITEKNIIVKNKNGDIIEKKIFINLK